MADDAAHPVSWSESLAFLTALLVCFVDMLGQQFARPVLVPIGRTMGASLDTIAMFTTVRFLGAIVSGFWMAKMSDSCGRKLVVMISLFGTALAYAVQGYAGNIEGEELAAFIVGRGLEGFFAGTQAVLKAYIIEISMPDQNLYKFRQNMQAIAMQTLGLGLSPIAGAISTFGLDLPFYLSAGVAVLVFLWSLCFFREAWQVKGTAKAKGEKEIGESDKEEGTKGERTPFCDAFVMLVTLGGYFLFFGLGAYPLFVPELLEEESYGLLRATEKETQAEIANALGLVGLPLGIVMLFIQLFMYIPLSKRFGDQALLIVSGVIGAATFVAFGILPSKLWHLAVLHGILGGCFGLLIPVMMPLVGKYAVAHFPAQLSMVMTIQGMGRNIAMLSSQPVMASVYKQAGMETVFIVMGIGFVIYVILNIAAIHVEAARAPKPELLTPSQRKACLELGSEDIDVDEFIRSVCERTQQLLESNKGLLWNRPIQQIVSQRALGILPRLRPWSDESHGEEYLEDLHALLRVGVLPHELQHFERDFPEFRKLQLRIPQQETAGSCVLQGIPGLLEPDADATGWLDISRGSSKHGVSSPPISDLLASGSELRQRKPQGAREGGEGAVELIKPEAREDEAEARQWPLSKDKDVVRL